MTIRLRTAAALFLVSGPAVTVAVRLALCGDLGAGNGTRTAQRTSTLITLVTGLVGDSHGYPPPATPG